MSKSYAKTWSVKSSNGHRSYTVAQNHDGTYECSCKGWTHHRSECRHIKEIKLGIRRAAISEMGKMSAESIEAKKAEIKSRLGLEGENKLLFGLKYDNQVPSRPEPEKVVDKRTPLEKIRDNASWRLAA